LSHPKSRVNISSLGPYASTLIVQYISGGGIAISLKGDDGITIPLKDLDADPCRVTMQCQVVQGMQEAFPSLVSLFLESQ
jgi:hypothetical protein